MKKLLVAAWLMFSCSFAMAQEKNNVDPMLDKDLMTWYHKDFSTSKVYGINTQNAYKYLESKGLKPKTVVVGVLDGGVEVDHPGLKKNMWTNPNEVPENGKDDDNNGYIDDIHGWNFIGGVSADVGIDNMEVTRVLRKYKPLFEGTNSTVNKANQASMPAEFLMYLDCKRIFNKDAIEAKQSFQTYTMIYNSIPSLIKLLNGNPLTVETLATIKPVTQEDARNFEVLKSLINDKELTGSAATELERKLNEKMKSAIDYFEPMVQKQFNLDYDTRQDIVGDNYDDYNEKIYGNNHYEGPDASHGTHVAGIISGLPHDSEVQYGVASKVAKIMTVRTVPDGDERDKDVANAIRYAVDNGARILNMSFGKPVSPGKSVVWDALQYAQDKGVLLVKAAGNDNKDVGVDQQFPTNYKNVSDEKPFVNNVLVVGASTRDPEFLRADFSNYNGKIVDVFAPGTEIFSTIPDGKYKYEQGTSMASPVAAGAAAVLLAYMPSLTPSQIIESLVNTANKSEVNAMLPTNTNNRFDMISRAGGVIDLRKAAEYAFTNFYQKSQPVKAVKPVKKGKVKK